MTTRTFEGTLQSGWNGDYGTSETTETSEGLVVEVDRLAAEGLDKLHHYLQYGLPEEGGVAAEEDPNFFVPPSGGGSNLA